MVCMYGDYKIYLYSINVCVCVFVKILMILNMSCEFVTMNPAEGSTKQFA